VHHLSNKTFSEEFDDAFYAVFPSPLPDFTPAQEQVEDASKRIATPTIVHGSTDVVCSSSCPPPLRSKIAQVSMAVSLADVDGRCPTIPCPTSLAQGPSTPNSSLYHRRQSSKKVPIVSSDDVSIPGVYAQKVIITQTQIRT
jgi:hypothetical protein